MPVYCARVIYSPRWISKIDDRFTLCPKVRNVIENSEMVRINRSNKAYGSNGSFFSFHDTLLSLFPCFDTTSDSNTVFFCSVFYNLHKLQEYSVKQNCELIIDGGDLFYGFVLRIKRFGGDLFYG